MYLGRVRVVGRAAVNSIRSIDKRYLVRIYVDAAIMFKNKKKEMWKRGKKGMAKIPP